MIVMKYVYAPAAETGDDTKYPHQIGADRRQR